MSQVSVLTRGEPSFDVVPELLGLVKSALRLCGTSFDDKLTHYVRVSLDLVERYTNRILVECEVTGRFNHASRNTLSCYPAVHFAVTPVYRDAFVSLAWSTDEDETLTGFAMPYLDQGMVFLTSEPADTNLGWHHCCALSNGGTEPYPIKAVIKAGYKQDEGGKWLCPDALKQAVAQLATYFYENPTDCGACGCMSGGSSNGVRLPQTVALLLTTYIVKRVY